MTGRRVHLGRHFQLLEETTEGVRLEGATRLQPGQLVEIIAMPGAHPSSSARCAWVVSWSITKLGKDGPTYQGLCRWQ